MAPPFKEVEFDIIYGEGISKEGDLLDLAANMNVIEKSGTWYTYKDERLGQGRDNSRNYLKEHPEMLKTVRAEVLLKAGITKTSAPTATQASLNSPGNGAQVPAGAELAGKPKMAAAAPAPSKLQPSAKK